MNLISKIEKNIFIAIVAEQLMKSKAMDSSSKEEIK